MSRRGFCIFILLLLSAFSSAVAQEAENIVCVELIDSSEKEPLGFALGTLQNIKTRREYGAIASAEGVCRWVNLPMGDYQARVMYMGREFHLGRIVVDGRGADLSFEVDVNPENIAEVVVTAAESQGMTSSSSIGREAMSHIQPSSIADLMALLPGGKSADPALSAPQQIRIREAGSITSEDYATGALGTSFVVDGVPMNTDANMQSVRVATSLNAADSYGFLNRGVDTRSVSTDDIESVEIVRGIPSVEYGDLTSGLVCISRKQGGRDLAARFKADMSSKLFYVGKGFEWDRESSRLTMNVGVDWLDSKNDPRNVRQSYSRATAMYRVGYEWQRGDYGHSVSGSIDYTGSFDRKKSDKDLDEGTRGPIETYKADYNRMNFMASWRMRARADQLLRSLEVTGSVTNEASIADSWRYVAMGAELPLSTTLEEGEYDVITLPAQYEATLRVESRPFYAFFKSVATLGFNTEHSDNSFKLGVEWRMNKNYGKGYIFDAERPISPTMNLRPRAYDVIPAQHQTSAFAEAMTNIVVGEFDFALMAGVRSTTLLNLGDDYALNGKTYFDPRLNVKISLPSMSLAGKALLFSIVGGAGWHTKMPTMSQLFPDPIYYDLQQMNYWPTNPDLRRINVKVFRIDPTNHSLMAARNFKWEVRGDVAWNGFTLSVTYFKEDMKSGFRSGDKAERFIYKKYDTQSLDHGSLTAPPSLDTTPYVMDTTLVEYSVYNNGSRTRKEGVEFVFSTKRINAIRTKLTVTGAYFRTRYSNSQPELYSPSVTINGKAYPYIGCYEVGTQNYERDMLNTNFMFDTQIPKLGLVFTTSFECSWFTGRRTMPYSAYPEYYIDKELNRYPFTEASAQNGILAHMVRTANETIFRYTKVPFAMDINLKVTKRLYDDKISASMFVNRIIHYYPTYESNGATIRRSAVPYFGMELNFRL